MKQFMIFIQCFENEIHAELNIADALQAGNMKSYFLAVHAACVEYLMFKFEFTTE
jgi:hypothetical protein